MALGEFPDEPWLLKKGIVLWSPNDDDLQADLCRVLEDMAGPPCAWSQTGSQRPNLPETVPAARKWAVTGPRRKERGGGPLPPGSWTYTTRRPQTYSKPLLDDYLYFPPTSLGWSFGGPRFLAESCPFKRFEVSRPALPKKSRRSSGSTTLPSTPRGSQG